MKKNNNISKGLGSVPDPLERLENYKAQKKALRKKLDERKKNLIETQSLKVCKKNIAVLTLNGKLVIILALFMLASSVQSQVKVAVIGDYRSDLPQEGMVAELVKSFNPIRIVTVGDNNYPNGSEGTIDRNIGKYYSEFIRYYKGTYKYTGADGRLYSGSQDTNRFLPALGNHDGYNSSFAAWDWYFGSAITLSRLSGNLRYYNSKIGNSDLVEFFIVNSAYGSGTVMGRFNFEPDGIDSNSVQANWLKSRLINSTAKWKIVIMHHPPYSSTSAEHLDTYHILRWNFKKWGADLLMTGHNHLYERLNIDSLTITVNGLGGDHKNPFLYTSRSGSIIQYLDNWGAQLLTIYPDSLNCRFINVNRQVVDNFTLTKGGGSPPPPPTPMTIEQRLRRLEIEVLGN